jgi:hypothetical protein
VAEHALEPDLEPFRQAGAFGVEALQVAVEVLARAVHRDARVVVHVIAGLVAAQFQQVGEHRQQVQLAGQRAATELGPRAR